MASVPSPRLCGERVRVRGFLPHGGVETMSNTTEPSGRSWRIRPSFFTAYLCGMLSLYAVSAGPMAHVLRSRPKLYERIYDPLCVVTNRLPSPIIDWVIKYAQAFEPEEKVRGCSFTGGAYMARRTGHVKMSYVLFRWEAQAGQQVKVASDPLPNQTGEIQ